MTRDGTANRLIHETSPYLLQHARNPVDWYPWGDEALQRAKDEDRLILLSIGYAACHWCHVMERESFENPAIASLMNEHYVNVKVDREERPDLDDIYMAATMAMNQGQGGWPMTVFLTPELEPVFAGTYFPPENRYGRPGFSTVLTAIAEAWRGDRSSLEDQARRLTEYLRNAARAIGSPSSVRLQDLESVTARFVADFDTMFGGFGGAPKFPPATSLSLLLRLHHRFENPQALEMVRKTLDRMARGGIYDHVGGGFARYSTDRRWLVPHFEKMLYDNALLATTYVEAFQVTGDEAYRRVARETLDYVLRDMTSPDGGFFSSTDADSEGEEGKYFVWRPEETREILGRDLAVLFDTYYDITAEGNWEGKSIPNAPRSLSTVAEELSITPEDLDERLRQARELVYRARCERTPPALDDKVLTGWNGLMISAMAAGARVFGEARYLDGARAAADFVLTTLINEEGGLLRTYRDGRARLDAYLEDYGYFTESLIDLYEVSGATHYLRAAERLLERLLSDFGDPETGAFYSTGEHHQRLLLRHRSGTDGATPSPNAAAGGALLRASYHLDRADFREAATRCIEAYGEGARQYPRAFARTLTVADLLLGGIVELVSVGVAGSADLQALRREIARHFIPRRVEALHDPTVSAPRLPLLRNKTLVDGRAALYICRDYACDAPITESAEVAAALHAAQHPLLD